MSNDTKKKADNQIIVTAKEASDMLGVPNTTLRKYAQLIEEQGRDFHRNKQGHRGFFHEDIALIKRVMELASKPDVSIDQAIKSVLSVVDTPDMSEGDTSKEQVEPITRDEFMAYQEKQEAFQKALLQKLDDQANALKEQSKYIKESLEKRDQLLLGSLKESQEARKEQENKPWWNFWS